MKIFVNNPNGNTLSLNVNPSDTVSSLKTQIFNEEGILPAQQRLLFGGRTLEDGISLAESQIGKECSINLVFGLRGGHCQVPSELKENAATVRKAMVQINELGGKGDLLSLNQTVRWINTKEEHAKKIITLVAEYSLCQRVKTEGVFATEKDYLDALKAHHGLMQAAMKAKQQVDTKFADALDHAIDDCCKMYMPAQNAASL
eukprot:maker-scaffold_13-snap-gene-11.5-mRNA-1 protein AED:0.17 eAED:0.17 QI:55/1/1/1/0/0/3/176/201